MSEETISEENADAPPVEIPSDIGRNDPCPCGSGKKYKKCCFRLHQAAKEATKARTSVEDLIDEETNPWDVFRLLQQVNENNLPALFHDMLHDAGPTQSRYPTVEEYLVAIEGHQDNMLARENFDCSRIRHDRNDAFLLVHRGQDDPKAKSIEAELVHLRRNEHDSEGAPREIEHLGWRIWDYHRHELSKADLGDTELKFSNFGLEWRTD